MKLTIIINDSSHDKYNYEIPFLAKPHDTKLITFIRYLFVIFSLVIIYTTISDIYSFDDYFNKLNYFTQNVVQISSFIFSMIFLFALEILRDQEEKYWTKLRAEIRKDLSKENKFIGGQNDAD